MKSIRSWLGAIAVAVCLSGAVAAPLRAAVSAPPADPTGPRNVIAYALCALAVATVYDIPTAFRASAACTSLYMSQVE